MGMDETRRSKYAEIAVEVLDLDVRRAHDRMVADEVAAKFIAVADAEQQAVASENERLCLEIESLHGRLADSEKTIVDLSGRVARRDAKLAKVEAQRESLPGPFSTWGVLALSSPAASGAPMPHAHCPDCLGTIGTHRTDCPRTNSSSSG